MPIIPVNPDTLIHNNLVYTMQDYWFEFPAGVSTDILKSAYIVDENDVVINPNAPLLSAKVNNLYRFNLKYILNNDRLFPNDALPEIGYTGFFKVISLVKKFKVRVGLVDSDYIYFYHGNGPDRILDFFGQKTFENFRKLGNPFLSYAPRLKLIKASSVQYLYYLNNVSTNPEIVKIKANVRLWDGSLLTTVLNTVAELNPYDIIASTVTMDDVIESFDKIKISPEDVKYYEVYLTTVLGEVITEYRKFVIDRSFEDDNVCLLYRNQFGVFETFDFDGQYSSSKDYTISSFQNETQTLDFETLLIEKITVRTSSLEKGWIRFLSEDLMQSNEIYWLHPDGRRIRLSKLTKSLKIKDEKDTTEKLEIELRIAKD